MKRLMLENEGARRSAGTRRGCHVAATYRSGGGLASAYHLGSVRMDLMLFFGYLGFRPSRRTSRLILKNWTVLDAYYPDPRIRPLMDNP